MTHPLARKVALAAPLAFLAFPGASSAGEVLYRKIKLGIEEGGKANGKINMTEDCLIRVAPGAMARITKRALSFDFVDPARPADFRGARLGFRVDGAEVAAVTVARPKPPGVVVTADDFKSLSRVRNQAVDEAYTRRVEAAIAALTDEGRVRGIQDPPALGVPALIAASPYVTYWYAVSDAGKRVLVERNIAVGETKKAELLSRFPHLTFFKDELKSRATAPGGATPPEVQALIDVVSDLGSHGCAAK